MLQIYHRILSNINPREEELDQRTKDSKTLHGSLARCDRETSTGETACLLDSR